MVSKLYDRDPADIAAEAAFWAKYPEAKRVFDDGEIAKPEGAVVSDSGQPLYERRVIDGLLLGFNRQSFLGDNGPPVRGGSIANALDEPTAKRVLGFFSHNIPGSPTASSQFAQPYTELCLRVPVAIELALGTEKAKEALLTAIEVELTPYRGLVAVWRSWPRIERRGDGGQLEFRARLHLMLKSEYRAFLPESLREHV
jgi:hypothetical protein